MLADEDPELRPEAAGGRDHHAEEQRGEQQFDLKGLAPAAAEIPDEIAADGDRDQENPRDQNGRGVEYDTPRHVQLERPAGIARCRYRNERNDHRIGNPPGDEDIGVEQAEQHGFGVEEDVERKHAGESDA